MDVFKNALEVAELGKLSRFFKRGGYLTTLKSGLRDSEEFRVINDFVKSGQPVNKTYGILDFGITNNGTRVALVHEDGLFGIPSWLHRVAKTKDGVTCISDIGSCSRKNINIFTERGSITHMPRFSKEPDLNCFEIPGINDRLWFNGTIGRPSAPEYGFQLTEKEVEKIRNYIYGKGNIGKEEVEQIYKLHKS